MFIQLLVTESEQVPIDEILLFGPSKLITFIIKSSLVAKKIWAYKNETKEKFIVSLFMVI